ncbi:hypothetical protein MTO96_023246 [Rhipicephalus appendiculatus]
MRPLQCVQRVFAYSHDDCQWVYLPLPEQQLTSARAAEHTPSAWSSPVTEGSAAQRDNRSARTESGPMRVPAMVKVPPIRPIKRRRHDSARVCAAGHAG